MASEKNKWNSSPRKAPDSFPAERGFPREESRKLRLSPRKRSFLKRIHARKARRWRRDNAHDRLTEES